MEKIVLIPVGIGDSEVLGELREGLGRMFCQVEIGTQIAHPYYAHDAKRNQYSPTAILAALRAIELSEDGRVLGVANVDFYSPRLKIVFGEADAEHGVAVFSFWRLRQVYSALPGEKKRLSDRALKEATHLLGHTYGLEHCWVPRCVMYPSSSLKDTDKKTIFFCYDCDRKLRNKGILREGGLG